MIAAAKSFVWAFFILIVDQAVTVMSSKYGIAIKPVYFYTVIALGLLISALLIEKGDRSLLTDKAFFLSFLGIVLIGIIMYRGEITGPDFGAMVSYPANVPSHIGYVVWPALNLAASAGLYLLARRAAFRSTIVVAALAALVLQIGTMEADMWWAALFGDANGRAGGLAQNANVAALLVTVLASLTISTRIAPYAVMLTLAGVALTQSKTGALIAGILLLCLLCSDRRALMNRRALAFGAGVAFLLLGTVLFSPVLNPSPQVIAEAASKVVQPDSHQLPAAKLDRPLSLEARIEARTSLDESASLRWSAIGFFLGLLKEHPFGLGTGFTNKFATGPHNTFLKLAVDNGVVSSPLLLLLLSAATWRAYVTRSAQLTCLSLIAWVASMLYHTFMVDPITLPALAASLGIAGSKAIAVAGESRLAAASEPAL
ncbi:O-antigen ligase family protein [Bradyrhizobium erythrophlei]|uniref:O-antigen ligase family protein n=1 Tax=Bradyrhizobium erythrophlei TaxID=1437360 RepID=UPI0035EA4ABB